MSFRQVPPDELLVNETNLTAVKGNLRSKNLQMFTINNNSYFDYSSIPCLEIFQILSVITGRDYC